MLSHVSQYAKSPVLRSPRLDLLWAIDGWHDPIQSLVLSRSFAEQLLLDIPCSHIGSALLVSDSCFLDIVRNQVPNWRFLAVSMVIAMSWSRWIQGDLGAVLSYLHISWQVLPLVYYVSAIRLLLQCFQGSSSSLRIPSH